MGLNLSKDEFTFNSLSMIDRLKKMSKMLTYGSSLSNKNKVFSLSKPCHKVSFIKMSYGTRLNPLTRHE